MRPSTELSPRERWLLANVAGTVLLDIGFAGQKGVVPGYFPLLRMKQPGIRLFGLDWNQEAVAARAQPDSLVADASALPVRKDAVDCIIMGEFLEHHVAIEKFLGEAQRVLKPGGLLLITTPNPLFLNRLLRRWLMPGKGNLRDNGNLAAAMGYHDHRVLWDPLSLAHIVTRAGFDVDEMSALGTWIPGLGRLVPYFRRSLLMNFWPANRFGYITCVRCRKRSTDD
jgi:SAM-dependent methyltransferase